MIEYECPECGELIESPDELQGLEDTCVNCLKRISVPEQDDLNILCGDDECDDEEWGYANESLAVPSGDSVASDSCVSEERGSRIGALITGVVTICVIGCYIGILALHFWTTYLFHEHWGPFWGFIVFFMPPLGEIVALFTCFWWGVWFYVLAVAAGVTTLFGIRIDECGRKAQVIWLAVMLTLVCSFSYFAWGHAFGPKSITAELREELSDCASAVVVIMQSAADTGDPQSATALALAKPRLRKRLKRCDKAEIDEICRVVNAFLAFEASSTNDLMKYFQHCADARETGNQPKRFRFSEKSVAAFRNLSPSLHRTAGGESIDEAEARIAKMFTDIVVTNVNPDWKEFMESHFARRRFIYKKTYEDLLGRPIPVQHQ